MEVGYAPGLTCSTTQSASIDRKDGAHDMPIVIDYAKQQSLPPPRRPIRTSIAPVGMAWVSSVSETCDTMGRLDAGHRQNDVFLPAKW